MTSFVKAITILLAILMIGGGVFYYLWKKENQALTDALTPKETETVTSFQTVLEEVEALGKLELVKYHFKDVVEHSKKHGMTSMLDTKVLLIIAAEAVGCMDLTKIKAKDIKEQGADSIFVHLPAPELCYYKIDHQNSKVYDSESLPFIKDENMVGEAFAKAEKQIEQAALSSGILPQTQAMAKTMLQPLLEKITQKRVVLTFEPMLRAEEKPKHDQ